MIFDTDYRFIDLCNIINYSKENGGELLQRMGWCEELSELIKAITKEARYGWNKEQKDNLIEEISDVLICIEEMQIYYGIEGETIKEIMETKIQRTKTRLLEKSI